MNRSTSLVIIITAAAFAAGCVPFHGPLAWRTDADAAERTRLIDSISLSSNSAAAPEPIESAEIDLGTRREPGDASVGEVAPLRIDELRLLALRNNLDLAVAAISPAIARERVSQEEAKFDAVITAGAAFKDQDLATGNTGLFSGSTADGALSSEPIALTEAAQDKQTTDLAAGLRVPIPTGGRLNVIQRFQIDDKDTLSLSSTEDRADFGLSFSQPLLRGAGVAVNTASIRLARYDAATIDAKTKLTSIRILASAEKAYWKLWAAERVLDVREEQYGLAFDNLRFVRRRIEEGANPEIDAFAVELAVAQRLELLINAETDVQILRRDLDRILNRGELIGDESAPPTPTSDPQLNRYTFDREQLAVLAAENRMELLEIELKLAADAIKVDLARNKALPLFLVEFGYGLGDRNSNLSSSFAGQFEFDNQSFGIGARAEIPVTNAAAEAALRRSLLTRQQRLATRSQRSLAIRQEVYNAVDVLERDWQRILAARQNVVAATANYNAERTGFTEGLRTAQDVLIALGLLGEARIKEVKSITSYQAAQIDLAFATGTLLGYARTDLAEGAEQDDGGEPLEVPRFGNERR